MSTSSASPVSVSGRRLSTPVAVALQGATVLLLLTGAGALAGVLWSTLWEAPAGVVQGGAWRTDETGLRADFSGTGLYVVVAVLTGLALGVLVALLLARSELVTLGCLLLGAALAAWVMYRVGLLDSPPDPRALAPGAADGTVLPGRLEVAGWSPFLALPTGALLAYAALLLAVPQGGTARADVAGHDPASA